MSDNNEIYKGINKLKKQMKILNLWMIFLTVLIVIQFIMGTVTIKKNTESDEFDEFKKVKTERIFIEDIYFDEWISDDKWSTFINLSVIITNRNLVKINPKIYVNVEGDTPSSIIPKTLIEIPPLASKEIIFHDSVLGTSSYSYTLKIMIEDELFYEKTFSD